MVRLNREFAIIATVNHIEKNTNWDIISLTDVMWFFYKVEQSSGIATLHGFTKKDIENFFLSNSEIFREVNSIDLSGNRTFKIASDKFKSKDGIAKWMIQQFDPPFNYPMDFLVASDMLKPIIGG